MRRSWTSILGRGIALAGTLSLAALSAGASTKPLVGMWGGDRAILTLDDKGGRLEFDCGYATLAAPIRVDRAGRFKAKGLYFPDERAKDADTPPKMVSASFEGAVHDGRLQLTFKNAAATAQSFEMLEGRRVKLIRCL